MKNERKRSMGQELATKGTKKETKNVESSKQKWGVRSNELISLQNSKVCIIEQNSCIHFYDQSKECACKN